MRAAGVLSGFYLVFLSLCGADDRPHVGGCYRNKSGRDSAPYANPIQAWATDPEKWGDELDTTAVPLEHNHCGLQV